MRGRHVIDDGDDDVGGVFAARLVWMLRTLGESAAGSHASGKTPRGKSHNRLKNDEVGCAQVRLRLGELAVVVPLVLCLIGLSAWPNLISNRAVGGASGSAGWTMYASSGSGK